MPSEYIMLSKITVDDKCIDGGPLEASLGSAVLSCFLHYSNLHSKSTKKLPFFSSADIRFENYANCYWNNANCYIIANFFLSLLINKSAQLLLCSFITYYIISKFLTIQKRLYLKSKIYFLFEIIDHQLKSVFWVTLS